MFVARAAASGFVPSGMNKSGNYTVTTSYADVPGWVADTTGYPGSTLSGNGVVAQRSKTGATISSSATVSSSSFSTHPCTLRLMVNGVVATTGTAITIPANSTGTAVTVSGTANVNQNDVVTLQAVTDIASVITITATATYVRIT
jgi:hypothetical protein